MSLYCCILQVYTFAMSWMLFTVTLINKTFRLAIWPLQYICKVVLCWPLCFALQCVRFVVGLTLVAGQLGKVLWPVLGLISAVQFSLECTVNEPSSIRVGRCVDGQPCMVQVIGRLNCSAWL